MKMTFDVTKVTILRVGSGCDQICLKLDDPTARKIHSYKYEIFQGVSLHFDVTRGRGEQVVEDMGIPEEMVEIISDHHSTPLGQPNVRPLKRKP
jgi:hypothetical protein